MNQEDALDESGRSGKPPSKIFYVAWGRTRLDTGRLYRDWGWAQRQARLINGKGYSVRIYQLAGDVNWEGIGEQAGVSDEAARRLRRWAGGDAVRRFLLENSSGEEPWLMRHPRLDATLTKVLDTRLLRRASSE